MPQSEHLDDQVTRAVIITWRTGEEPSIDATGIAAWELYSLLDHCLDLLAVEESAAAESGMTREFQ